MATVNVPQVNLPGAGSLLGAIARPAIADFGGQMRAGRESVLKRKLMQAQEARAASQEMRAQSQEQRAAESFGLQKQQLQGNLSDAQFNSAVKRMALIGTVEDQKVRQSLFNQVKGSVKGNPLLENIVSAAEELPPERSGKFWKDIDNFATRAGILESPTATTAQGRVLSSDILDDGTIIQSTQGGPVVWSAGGEQLKGEAATKAIKKARQMKIDEQRQIAKLKAEQKGLVLSPTVEKMLDTTQNKAFDAETTAGSLGTLADDFATVSGTGGGIKVGVSEFLKDQLGGADELSALRREFRGIRASQATKNLPPGPASDKDIALALSGFPPENAPPEQVESFLRGAQKSAAINAAFQTYRAEYISETGSVRGFISDWNENKDMIIEGAISEIPDGPLEIRRKGGQATPPAGAPPAVPMSNLNRNQRRNIRTARGQQPAPAAAPGGPRRIKLDAQGNIIQ